MFLAVKRHRDHDLGGVIRFWPAFGLGLGVSFVASLGYVLAWEVALAVTGMDFGSTYANAVIEARKAKGLSGEALAKLVADMEAFKVQYANPVSRTLSYDGLDRLTQAVGASFGTANYGYNTLDNLTTLKVTAGSGVRDQVYHYDASNRLTSVTHTVGGATVVGLGYDVQGNLANKNGRAYTFDFGNRLRAVGASGSSPASGYVYDGHGRRVRDYTTASKYSSYSADGKLMYATDGRLNVATQYVYLNGSLVAYRESPASGTVIKYPHTDALGTPIAVTDASRAIVETSEYEPYGQLSNRALTDGPGYTGHVQDAATGLTYMQQRYYDPLVGRFLSVDPVTANSGTGANFNRYWYANNNPYRFTDPDGRLSRYCSGTLCERYREQGGWRCEMTCLGGKGNTT